VVSFKRKILKEKKYSNQNQVLASKKIAWISSKILKIKAKMIYGI